MSKPKKHTEADQLLTQGWHTLVDTIRLLPLYPRASAATTDAEREHDVAMAIAEKHTLDDALDQVALMIRLRSGETLPPFLLPTLTAKAPSHSMFPTSLPPSSAPTWAAGGAGGGSLVVGSGTGAVNSPAPPSSQHAGVKRKHRVSVSASPAPPASGVGPGSARDGLMAPLTASRHASPMPGTAKGSGEQQARGVTRKEMLQNQLPLKPGRKVAYKTNEPEAQWILCRVLGSIPGEKHAYRVQDDDNEERQVSTLTDDMHTATIKSLLPLPDYSLPSTSLGHPDNLEDWPKDSQVLALYPTTTTFYMAQVLSAPVPGTGHGLGPRGGVPKRKDPEALDGKYRLAFVDDDQIHVVAKDDVVPYPLFNPSMI